MVSKHSEGTIDHGFNKSNAKSSCKIEFDFKAGTEANGACTIVFRGQTLLLGGRKEYNQFSQVIPKQTRRVRKCEEVGDKSEEKLQRISFDFPGFPPGRGDENSKCTFEEKTFPCGLEGKGTELPFKKNLYAKINCGVFEFKNEGEAALICRHKECYK